MAILEVLTFEIIAGLCLTKKSCSDPYYICRRRKHLQTLKRTPFLLCVLLFYVFSSALEPLIRFNHWPIFLLLNCSQATTTLCKLQKALDSFAGPDKSKNDRSTLFSSHTFIWSTESWWQNLCFFYTLHYILHRNEMRRKQNVLRLKVDTKIWYSNVWASTC